ncbi:MAG: stage III sporulation protein AF [Clostridia bacterium]|jgi:stage III sporulation protein AF|nr:stage III sporulation protein AF [Clostridia bacterium]
MINFISSWAEQIVIAVIIATIIELVLPNNKNRKYIQMVIGVYILFNIISPIIKNKEEFNKIDEYKVEEYNTTNSQYIVDQSSMDKRLEKIYLEELENNIRQKFTDKGYTVSKCVIDAELDTTKRNAGIHQITVKITPSMSEGELNDIRNEIIEEYEISKDKINILMTK